MFHFFRKRNQAEAWESFDPIAYEANIEALAINAAARFARGGVALQVGRVLTCKRFEEEMEHLKNKVITNNYSF